MKTQLWAIGLVLLGSIIGAFGPIYLKKSAKNFFIKNPLNLIKNKDLIIGTILSILGTFLFLIALKGGDLSILYSFVSTGYIFVMFYSMKMLNEKMNRLKWSGVLFIIIGVIFIGLGA